MTHIAFFGHDAADSAVRRRVAAFQHDGLDVTGFMMRRRDVTPEWDNIDLGLTRDGAFVQRIRAIFAGAKQAAQHRDQLAGADVIYARNLDMLACAFLAKRYAKLATPVIYESLDVHRMLVGDGIKGRILRRLEGWLLSKSRGLVVSSPGFIKHHFDAHYRGRYRGFLVENRLASGMTYGARPIPATIDRDRPLRIGWIGMLRCDRSFKLLCALADQLGDRIEVHLHGIPARTEIAVFEPEIEARANVHYHGRYVSPEDLASIYDPLDLVWAGDFMEAGYNSVWLLPNRIYEGGYYNVPSIAPAGTETAAWLEQHGCGHIIPEPLEETLPDLITAELADPAASDRFAAALSDMHDEIFVQPGGFLKTVILRALDPEADADF